MIAEQDCTDKLIGRQATNWPTKEHALRAPKNIELPTSGDRDSPDCKCGGGGAGLLADERAKLF